jgi:MFS family permease
MVGERNGVRRQLADESRDRFMTDTAEASAAFRSTKGIYFGWQIVVALFLVTFAIFGVSIYSFIIFTQPLAREFGWSATQTGGLVSAMWFVAPIALFSGLLTTRVPAWRLIVFGLCVQAAVLVSLGFVTELWQLYLLRMVMGVGKIVAITAAPVILARWFSRRFATAMAFVWAGGAAGGLILAPLTETLVSAIGWRPAALAIAVGLLVVTLVITLIARGSSSPEQLGWQLDGDLPAGVLAGAVGGEPSPTQLEGEPADQALTGRQALRALNPLTSFLMFVSVTGTGMAAIAVMTQEPVLLEGAGLTPALAATLLGVTAGGSLVGSFTIGWIMDRLHGLWGGAIVAGAVFAGVAALGLLPNFPGLLLSVIGAFCLGYGFGAGEPLWIALTKRQFGAALFATTYGGWYVALQAGYAAGGSVAGWSFEHLGARGFLMFVALVYVPAAICSLTLRAARQPAPLRTTVAA